MAGEEEAARAAMEHMQESPTRGKRHKTPDESVLARMREVLPTVLVGRAVPTDESGRRVISRSDNTKRTASLERTRGLKQRVEDLQRQLANVLSTITPHRPTMTGGEVQAALNDLPRARLSCPVVLDLGNGFVADLFAVKAGGPREDECWYIELELGTVRLRRPQ